MATTNKRTYRVYGGPFNGVDVGGLMRADIQEGFDTVLATPADGLDIPLVDCGTEYVRGSIQSQDWPKLIELLAAAAGSYVCYERKSGIAVATGFIKHTINNPIVHRVGLSLTHRKYGIMSASFECKATDPTSTIETMHALTDSVAGPTYIESARSIEITAATHGSQSIYHTTGLSFDLGLSLFKESGDGDIGYTIVEAVLGGVNPTGSITFQDSSIAAARILAQTLIRATKADLVLTVKQSQGAAAKTLTIANVKFTDYSCSPSAENQGYNDYTVNFMVVNDATTHLLLAGILTAA